ncbi:MAG: class I SAM-dependent methyltransferase family protein [Euryarchaeota archaeon]|nr:class I SAM-dependent methyltransferase family protein [Euryarchaeota archaeon]
MGAKDAVEEAATRSVVVPIKEAEAVRRALSERGLLDPALHPTRIEEGVAFALVPDADLDAAAAVATGHRGRLDRSRFTRRETRPASYRDLLADLPQDLRPLLPSSFDIVGHVAIVKLPEALVAHTRHIADAVLQAQRNITTVALDKGVKGELRVRDLEVVAGEPTLTTFHREHGVELEVALDRVYFSPRLATERRRLAERMAPGARVLDLFAGVGAFVVLVARDQAPAKVCAIDLNPDAVHLLGRNMERNRITAEVEVRTGDARLVAPRTGDWDHVVMNLPHGAAAFLDVAAECVAPDGEVHLYAMVERATEADTVAALEVRLSGLTGAPWRVVERRHVRNYSPTMDGVGYTLSAR